LLQKLHLRGRRRLLQMRDKFAGGKLARQMWMVNPQTMLTLNVMQDMLRFGPP
jgi:hypothetical protein